MIPLPDLNDFAELWLRALWRASWQGSVALVFVWAMVRAFPRLPANFKVWLWRLGFIKMLFAFCWVTPIDIALLPARPPTHRVAAPSFAPPRRAFSPLKARALQRDSILAPPALNFSSYLLLLWVIGLATSSVVTVRKFLRAKSLRDNASHPESFSAAERCQKLAEAFRMKSAPEVLESADTCRPLLVGMFRPTILLPQGAIAGLGSGQLRMILAHELAHVKRHDLLWMMLFTLVEGLFFFNPVLWRVRREWALAQEMACDEWVLRLGSVSVSEYATLLLQVVAQTSAPSLAPFPTVGIVETKKTLERRLLHMKLIKPNSPKRMLFAVLALILSALIGILPWRLVAQTSESLEEITKLKEENARLRAELDQARAQSDSAHQRNKAWEQATAQFHAAQEKMEEQLKKLPESISLKELSEKWAAAQEQLQKGLQKYTEAHPLVQEQRAKLDALQREIEKFAYDLVPRRGTKMTFVPAAGAGTKRNTKPNFAERELIREELKLAEQEAEWTKKRFEAGTATQEELLAVQRELFAINQQLAALESTKAEQKVLIDNQIKVVEQQLAEATKRIEKGVSPAGSELPFRREILKLRRQQLELDAGVAPKIPSF